MRRLRRSVAGRPAGRPVTAVSRRPAGRPVTAEAKVRSQVQGMLGLWWTKWHCDWCLTQHFGLHLSASYHQCSIHIIIICILTLLLSEGQSGEAWKHQNAMLCRISESTGQNILHTALQALIMFFAFHLLICTQPPQPPIMAYPHHPVPRFSPILRLRIIPVQRPGYSKRLCGQLNVSPWRSITRLHA